MISLRHII
ncbi:unnamed protein product [Acanthoscelides obtectus]|uniref:Uncharacterized protein n=1 Tax=Acanthoscelides obtectus TaxID=200917 RepID=A0A9P0MIB1_ACAOB|nr:unnamed protein product [Acanthoscelides obtectus]CAK1675087.1 hypothetical protein AOBTE_LOCUS29892 [Acanthoscelides obtectus]